MKLIGLTGGIAAGTSTVAEMLRALGAVVIEADEIAREVVEPEAEVYRRIVEAFGRAVLHPDGTLDRKHLAALIFADPDARRRLNAITHPEIRRRIREQIEQVRARDLNAVLVIDIPLLLDTAGPEAFDLDGVMVVQATPELQIVRLMTRDGLSRDEARHRLAAQRPVAEKAAKADWVIDNTGTIDQTRRQVEKLWEALRAV